MTYIYLFIAGMLGYVLGRKFAQRRASKKAKPGFAEMPEDKLEEIRKEAREATSQRTEKRKAKILTAIESANEDFKMGCNLRDGENEKGITCNEVEKLLDISESTAHRYLNELEKEGKIKQVGSTGKSVYYVLAK